MYAWMCFMEMYGYAMNEKKVISDALKFLESNDIKSGKDLLLKVVETNPSNVSAWKVLCGIAIRTSDWDLGILSFKQLAELIPNSCLASSGLVKCYMENGESQKAIDEINRFKLNSNFTDDEETKIVLEEHHNIAQSIKMKGGKSQ